MFETTILYLLTQFATQLKVKIEKELAEFHLHSGQIFILFELWKSDGMSQIDLSRKILVSPPTTNKMVKSLEKNQFVFTKTCKLDKRSVRVYLTPKGLGIRPEIEEKWKNIENSVTNTLSLTEQIVLKDLFIKINRDNFNAES
ncbi:MAG: MarR family transcriptional regulator [Acidobacteria bacterium]|nr:MarR family transcriptional regulator [Acidobacteriota bacterium]